MKGMDGSMDRWLDRLVGWWMMDRRTDAWVDWLVN